MADTQTATQTTSTTEQTNKVADTGVNTGAIASAEAVEATQPASGTPVQPTWLERLPDHLKSDKQLSKFESEEKLAEGYINASKLIGKRVQDLTSEELAKVISKEDLVAYAKSRGMPTDIKDYKLPDEEFTSKLDPKFVSSVSQKAYELGLTPAQTETMVKLGLELQNNKSAEVREIWQSEVFNQYGRDYEKALAVGKAALNEFGSPEFKKFLNDTGLGDNPHLFNLLVNIGQKMKSDTFPTGVTNASVPELKQAQEELAALKSDKALVKQWSRGEKYAVDKFEEAYAKLHALEAKYS